MLLMSSEVAHSRPETLADVQDARQRGEVTFFEVALWVNANVLVPRRETELLAETAVSQLEKSSNPAPRVIDMCCGAGNLAIVVAQRIPSATVWAADLTNDCVKVTRRNVERYRLKGRVTVKQGDLFESLAGEALEGSIDVIVSNPPYISTGKLQSERAELLAAEPREAFDAGPYGLSIHQRLAREAPVYLKRGGHLMFEFGIGQERQVQVLLDRARAYRQIEMICDAEGRPRVAHAIKA